MRENLYERNIGLQASLSSCHLDYLFFNSLGYLMLSGDEAHIKIKRESKSLSVTNNPFGVEKLDAEAREKK